nr:hypothetical protein [uncultured Chryseobacterium sp.]
MKRIYFALLFFAMFFMFNGCQKDHTPTDPEQTPLQSEQEITSLYQVTSKYGLHRFTKRYGNLTPDYKAISITKVDGQDVISLPLRMDISSNVTLQLVMIKKQGETYAQVSEFISDATSKKDASEVNGTLTIYRVNGILYKKYQVIDGKTSLITDSAIKKAGAGASNNGDDDEDGDGVPNKEDKCPNTPADTWVDPEGCPVDNDLPEVVVPNPNPGPGTGLPGDGGYNPNPGPDPGWPGDGGDGTGGDGGSSGGSEGYFYIYNKVSNPCLRALVAGIIDRDINFKANESMKSIFGVGGKFNLIFHDTTGLANDVNGNATPSKLYFDNNGNLLSMDVDIQLNVNNLPGSSQEYIAMVAVHEAIHAYLSYKGYAFANNQHDLMLANYVELMAKYLTDNYNMPAADAYSVAMGGLFDAFQNSVNNQTWDNIAAKLGNKLPSLNERSRILADYETGHKGKKCN